MFHHINAKIGIVWCVKINLFLLSKINITDLLFQFFLKNERKQTYYPYGLLKSLVNALTELRKKRWFSNHKINKLVIK